MTGDLVEKVKTYDLLQVDQSLDAGLALENGASSPEHFRCWILFVLDQILDLVQSRPVLALRS